MGRLGVWAAIAAGVLAGGLLLDGAGLLAIALARPGELAVPPNLFRAAQAVAGVSLGAYLQSDALRVLASSWLPVALVSLATLGLSLLCGSVLTRLTPLDPPTAALGSRRVAQW